MEPTLLQDRKIAGSGTFLKRSELLSLRNLPLSSFIDCLIDGDLSVLGEGTPEVLKAHWEVLYQEFCDAIATTDTKGKIGIDANISTLDLKIARLQLLIDCCRSFYRADVIELLKDEGFTYPFTEESYLQDLEAVVAESRRYVILRNQYQSQKDKTLGTDTKLDYQYFASILNAISEMVKFDVNDSINTLRFCRYYVQLIAHIQKSMNNGR